MFFVAGANLLHLGAARSAARCRRRSCRRPAAATRWTGSGPGSTRGPTPLGDGFHTVQGLLALGARRHPRDRPRREPGRCSCRTPFNDFIFAEIGQEFGLIGAGIVIALFLVLAYAGTRVALAAPDTFGALLAAGHHRLAVHPGVHQHRRRRRRWSRSPASRCRSSAPAARRSSSASRRSGSSCRSRARPSRRGPGTTMRLLIAGGGTGGHIYPALAVARSLARAAGRAELSWLGGHRGLEASIVPAAGIPLRRLALRSLRTVGPQRPRGPRPAPPRPRRSRRRRRSWPASGPPRSSRPAATSRSRS